MGDKLPGGFEENSTRAWILKDLAEVLMAIIFEALRNNGELPEGRRVLLVVPIFKKGSGHGRPMELQVGEPHIDSWELKEKLLGGL